MDFAEQFKYKTEAVRRIRMAMVVRRSMAVQARAKIKPTIMNPSLEVMSQLRGGDAVDNAPPLELYWPGK